MTLVFILFVVYQLKHFVADYPLQGRYMLGKFKDNWSFFFPLLAHVGVHAALTFLIALFLVGPLSALALAMFDATIHFFMDRIKASKRYLGRFKPITAEMAPTATPLQWRQNDYFWYAMGFDQMTHHLTHYAIIWWIVTHQ